MHTAISAITPLTHKDDDWRGVLMRGLVDFHYRYYHRLTYRDKQPWTITTDQLQDLPKNSVGYHLGQFLQQHGFQLLPKFENHDLFHVLLGYQTTVIDEVRMQCCLAASGRRTFPHGLPLPSVTCSIPNRGQCSKQRFNTANNSATSHTGTSNPCSPYLWQNCSNVYESPRRLLIMGSRIRTTRP